MPFSVHASSEGSSPRKTSPFMNNLDKQIGSHMHRYKLTSSESKKFKTSSRVNMNLLHLGWTRIVTGYGPASLGYFTAVHTRAVMGSFGRQTDIWQAATTASSRHPLILFNPFLPLAKLRATRSITTCMLGWREKTRKTNVCTRGLCCGLGGTSAYKQSIKPEEFKSKWIVKEPRRPKMSCRVNF